MRRYLLDSGPLAGYLLGRPWAVRVIDPWLDQEEAATSILVYGEIVEYLQGSLNAEVRQRQLRQQLQEIRPYALTYAIMERYATIRRQLRAGLGLIGDIDTLIAATALERQLTLVTIDTDFQRVPGLSVVLLART